MKIFNNLTFRLILQRLLISLGVILFLRIGSFLPVPGINHIDLALYIQSNSLVRNVVNTFSGKDTFVIGLFGTLSAKAKDIDSEVKEVKATLEFFINIFVFISQR